MALLNALESALTKKKRRAQIVNWAAWPGENQKVLAHPASVKRA
jgi:hypothetical protein